MVSLNGIKLALYNRSVHTVVTSQKQVHDLSDQCEFQKKQNAFNLKNSFTDILKWKYLEY